MSRCRGRGSVSNGVSNGVEQCRTVSNVSNLTFDMNGASSHKLVSKWCQRKVSNVCRNIVSKCVEVSKPGLRNRDLSQLQLFCLKSISDITQGFVT